MPRDLDWLTLIDRRAAMREQFPSLSRVMRERPGSERDRANREFYRAENRASLERSRGAHTVQESDAERFIEQMRESQRVKFLARFASRQNERKAS